MVIVSFIFKIYLWNLIYWRKKAFSVTIICTEMHFRDKNLGKYLNIYRNLQKELVISTVLLSCIYIDMKCVFYVKTVELLRLKWIKNKPNMAYLNRILLMNSDSKVQLPWQVRYLSDMVLIFWSIAIRCACMSICSSS